MIQHSMTAASGYLQNDTIFALATPPGKSGVAVIRISGIRAGYSLKKLGGLESLPSPRRATLISIYKSEKYQPAVSRGTFLQQCGKSTRIQSLGIGVRGKGVESNEGSENGRQLLIANHESRITNHDLIDRALAVWFPAPHSFTGEDVVEFHIHGSRAVINALLTELVHIEGLRPAEPGEFSRRAFENGKMDLAQAEGLADLIDAETEAQRKLAMRQMSGEISVLYNNFREKLIELLANIEAYIDFPDEDIPKDTADKMAREAEELLGKLRKHLEDKRGEIIRDGLYITIVGAPNAGKSSLLNALARRDVAIVSNIAGTTRDIIETRIDIGGLPVTLADTAGLRETVEEIESEGIKRALTRAENSDLKICVFDANVAPDEATLKMVDENSVVVVNKIDEASGFRVQVSGKKDSEFGVRSSDSEHHIVIARGFSPEAIHNNISRLDCFGAKAPRNDKLIIFTSVRTGEGIDSLLEVLKNEVENRISATESPIITRERHRVAVSNAAGHLEEFINGMKQSRDIELAAEDLRLAARELGKITGIIGVEDILDKIFSSFCIGK